MLNEKLRKLKRFRVCVGLCFWLWLWPYNAFCENTMDNTLFMRSVSVVKNIYIHSVLYYVYIKPQMKTEQTTL